MNSDQSSQDDPHYCKECDDEVPATVSGGVVTCDVCNYVIYK